MVKGKQFKITALLTLVSRLWSTVWLGEVMVWARKSYLFSRTTTQGILYPCFNCGWFTLRSSYFRLKWQHSKWSCDAFLLSLVKIHANAWHEIWSCQSKIRTRFRIRSPRLSASGQIESNVGKGSRQIGFVPLAKGLALGAALLGL